jgi:hypothetical protein
MRGYWGDDARPQARILLKAVPVIFTTEPLSKSVVGKLQRKKLREPYWQGHDRRVGGV